jgi:hypothetical protein
MDKTFRTWVKERYQVSHGDVINDKDIETEMLAYEEE